MVMVLIQVRQMQDVLNFPEKMFLMLLFNVAVKQLLLLICMKVDESLMEVLEETERSRCFVQVMPLAGVRAEVVEEHTELQKGMSRRQKASISRNHNFLLRDFFRCCQKFWHQLLL